MRTFVCDGLLRRDGGLREQGGMAERYRQCGHRPCPRGGQNGDTSLARIVLLKVEVDNAAARFGLRPDDVHLAGLDAQRFGDERSVRLFRDQALSRLLGAGGASVGLL